MRRSPLLAIVLLLALPAPWAHAGAPKTAIFFYPWYSNMRHDGHYSHWTQGGHTPPFDIASAFFPARGPYSSGDLAPGIGIAGRCVSSSHEHAHAATPNVIQPAMRRTWRLGASRVP